MGALLTGGIIVLAWYVVARRAHRYGIAFQAPARRDDFVTCREGPVSYILSLDGRGFDVPPVVVGHGRTVFLRLALNATLKGHLVEPFIAVAAQEAKYCQYFERGVAGFRYLNLSPIFQGEKADPCRRISLDGFGLRWKGVASLLVFQPPPLSKGRVLVLAPHPDDAEIATYGVYSTTESWVVTITPGERGAADLSEVVPGGAGKSAWMAKLRLWDSLAIPQLGGVPADRCVNLVYPDGQLQDMFREPTRAFRIACEAELSRTALRSRNTPLKYQRGDSECTWEGLVRELRELVHDVRPSAIFCPHPILDAHPDHAFTTMALEQALRDLPPQDALVIFLYTTFIRDAGLYPFGPAESVTSLPPLASKEWVADSICSRPLTPESRLGKYFAIEAAHDLRAYSVARPPTAREVVRDVKRSLSNLIANLGSNPLAFERRAPRPNEIYYVVSPRSLSLLVQRALTIDAGDVAAR